MNDICLIHGWGVNRAVWQDVTEFYKNLGRVHIIDLPGYGERSDENFPSDIDNTVRQMTNYIPEDAVVIAWSLGAVLALYVQTNRLARFKALQLITSTPKFVSSPDWNYGQSVDNLSGFFGAFENSFDEGLRAFLLLQLGIGRQTRQQAKALAAAIREYPDPTIETLRSGLAVLENADLRANLVDIDIPVQIICAQRDQVCVPGASRYIHEHIAGSELVTLDCGHMPFYSCRTEYIETTQNWFNRIRQLKPNATRTLEAAV